MKKINEVALMKKFKEYEDTRSVALRNEIIEMNIPLVTYTVIKYLRNIGIDTKELISLGYFGLINAVQTYDSDYGATFSSYATKCILNYIKGNLHSITDIKITHYNYPILKAINTIEKTTGVSLKENLSELDSILEEDIFTDELIKEKVKEYIKTQNVSYNEESIKETYELEDSSTNKMFMKRLEEELDNLTEIEREIIKLRYGFYGSCYGVQDIGNYKNCTHQNISRIEKKALKKLIAKMSTQL